MKAGWKSILVSLASVAYIPVTFYLCFFVLPITVGTSFAEEPFGRWSGPLWVFPSLWVGLIAVCAWQLSKWEGQMETTRYPWWKSTVWFMASVGYAAIVTVLSLSVGVTFRSALGTWALTCIVVAVLALLAVGWRAAKHGLRLYQYALAVTIGSVPVFLIGLLLSF